MCEVSAGLSVAHGLCGAWTRVRAWPLPALHIAGWQGGAKKNHTSCCNCDGLTAFLGLKHSRNIQS